MAFPQTIVYEQDLPLQLFGQLYKDRIGNIIQETESDSKYVLESYGFSEPYLLDGYGYSLLAQNGRRLDSFNRQKPLDIQMVNLSDISKEDLEIFVKKFPELNEILYDTQYTNISVNIVFDEGRTVAYALTYGQVSPDTNPNNKVISSVKVSYEQNPYDEIIADPNFPMSMDRAQRKFLGLRERLLNQLHTQVGMINDLNSTEFEDVNFELFNNDASTVEETETSIPIGRYREFKRSDSFDLLDEMAKVLKRDGINETELQNSVNQTQEFLENIYSVYEGSKTFNEVTGISLDEVESVFTVPARGDYVQEAQQVIEITKHLDLNNIEHKMLFRRMLKNLPPFILSMYYQNESSTNPNSVMVYSPQDLSFMEEAYEMGLLLKSATKSILRPDKLVTIQRQAYQLVKDRPEFKEFFDKSKLNSPWNPRFLKRLGDYLADFVQREGSASINESLSFINRITPNQIMHAGLGAILPMVANYGKNIDRDNLGIEVTTGHRLTVYAMFETLQRVLENDGLQNDEITIGVVGSGAIGSAASRVTLDRNPKSKLVIFDRNPKKAKRLLAQLIKEDKTYSGRVIIVDDMKELLKQTKYIYSAVTSKWDIYERDESGEYVLDQDGDPVVMEEYRELLQGTVEIDDSEPMGNHPKSLKKYNATMAKPLLKLRNLDLEDHKGNKVYLDLKRRGVPYRKKQKDKIKFGDLLNTLPRYDYGYIQGINDIGPGLSNGVAFGCEAEQYLALMQKKHNILNYKFPNTLDNPIILGRPVKAEDMRILDMNGFVDKLSRAVKFEDLQGGGQNVSSELTATSKIRQEFYQQKAA